MARSQIPKTRPCKHCGGGHRTKRAAKRCAVKHKGLKPWSDKELGL